MSNQKREQKEVDPYEKDFFQSDSYLARKAELHKEINSNVMIIDYSVFKMDQATKDKTMEMKLQNRENRKHYYGDGNYKKHLNIPEKQVVLFHQFIEAFKFRDKELTESIHLTF